MGVILSFYINILKLTFEATGAAKKRAECSRICYILFPFGKRSINLIDRSRADRYCRYPNGRRYLVLN